MNSSAPIDLTRDSDSEDEEAESEFLREKALERFQAADSGKPKPNANATQHPSLKTVTSSSTQRSTSRQSDLSSFFSQYASSKPQRETSFHTAIRESRDESPPRKRAVKSIPEPAPIPQPPPQPQPQPQQANKVALKSTKFSDYSVQSSSSSLKRPQVLITNSSTSPSSKNGAPSQLSNNTISRNANSTSSWPQPPDFRFHQPRKIAFSPAPATSSSTSSASPQPQIGQSRPKIAVEIILRKPHFETTSDSSSAALHQRTLKRKHRHLKEDLLIEERPSPQLLRRDSGVTSDSSTWSNVVDPTDFSTIKDDRDFFTLFEPVKKSPHPGSEGRLLEIPSDLKQLTASKGSPYRRALKFYKHKLDQIQGPRITFSNTEDDVLPDGKFEFIETYITFPGVERAEEGFNTGCACATSSSTSGECDLFECSCAAQDENNNGQQVIPYERGIDGVTVLTEAIIGLMVPIFECNIRCDCKDSCINRVVQKGRTIRLEIFRAGRRGFGLRSPDAIQKGQFIDLYLGEVLTSAQTKARENSHASIKASYLFALDMFDSNHANIYNVDGRYKGNATRFMNHSCKPNCKLYIVLYDHADQRVYDLAFFAVEDISPGTELTFDYNPNYSEDERRAGNGVPGRPRKGTRSNVVDEEVATECLCGEENCRGKVWL